jgi:hypothetical protein
MRLFEPAAATRDASTAPEAGAERAVSIREVLAGAPLRGPAPT